MQTHRPLLCFYAKTPAKKKKLQISGWCCKMKTQQLRPRVLVSYVRGPYVYAAGSVKKQEELP